MKFFKWLRKYFRVSYNEDGIPTFGIEVETDKTEIETERKIRKVFGIDTQKRIAQLKENLRKK